MYSKQVLINLTSCLNALITDKPDRVSENKANIGPIGIYMDIEGQNYDGCNVYYKYILYIHI